MKKVLIVLGLISLCNQSVNAQWQRSLLGIFGKAVLSGFGGALGEDLYDSVTGMRANNVSCLYPELASRLDNFDSRLDNFDRRLSNIDGRLGVIEKNMSQLESQIYEINNQMRVLKIQLMQLQSDMPYGSFGLGYGLGEYNAEGYSTMNSLAVINMKKASIGLNLTVHTFDPPQNGELVREKAELNNILTYARFGSEEDDAHVLFGAVNTSGFGNNFLFRNYSNDIIYNDRQIGFKAGIRTGPIGIEMLASGLSDNRLKAGRVYVRPMVLLDIDNPVALSNLGLNYIVDVDNSGQEVKVIAYDAQIPVYMKVEDGHHTFINIYGNYAEFNDFGKGYGVGVSGEMKSGEIGVGGWFEYRHLNENFLTGYFNPFYELGRYDNNYSSFSLMEQTLSEVQEQSMGIEFQAKYLGISGYYVLDVSENPQIKNNYMHLQAKLGIPIPIGNDSYITIFGVSSLDRRNIEKFEIKWDELFDNDSFNSIFSFSGGISIPVQKRADIFGKYVYRDFFLLNDDQSLGKIKNSSFLFGLQYSWGGYDD